MAALDKDSREVRGHTGFLIRVAQQRHVAIWAQVVGPETTNVQYGVLTVLARRPGSSQKDICDELELDRSTIADVCLRMEKSGLLSRQPALDDRRRNVLMLTESGADELARIRPLVDAVQRVLLEHLSEEESTRLRELLLKILGE